MYPPACLFPITRAVQQSELVQSLRVDFRYARRRNLRFVCRATDSHHELTARFRIYLRTVTLHIKRADPTVFERSRTAFQCQVAFAGTAIRHIKHVGHSRQVDD